MKVLFNYTSPQSISTGEKRDKIVLVPRDPDLFISKETGKPIDISKLEISVTLPR